MLKSKRVIGATIIGLILGLLFWLIFKVPMPLWYILTGGLLGFVIGVSALRMGWWLHGIIMGLVVTLPRAVTQQTKWWLVLVVGLVVGFLIELITSVIFRAQTFGNQKEIPVE